MQGVTLRNTFTFHHSPDTSEYECTLYAPNLDNIRSSEKFLSFYKEIMDAQRFPFYIILSNYV